MEIIAEPLPGLKLLQARSFKDDRGEFVKPYNDEVFRSLGMPMIPREIVFSISRKDVLRGMHFQTPGSDHQKLVTCAAGSIIDVVVDIRNESPSYGQYAAFELTELNRHTLLVPRGFAHGFLALEEKSLVSYCTDTGHDPARDSGIRWDSFGYDWPVQNPIISEKDQKLVGLDDYQSPFVYSV
jgi:dTDP-4-dehydrorhamnose 3,5-epimerase